MPSSFESAVNKVDSILGGYPARRLSTPELSSVTAPNVSDGWRIETDLFYLNKPLSMIMLVKKDFPFSRPMIYTDPSLPCLEFPHIESNGRLCIWPDHISIDPIELSNLEDFIQSAYTLISENLQHNLDDDFKDGFLSYWSLECSSKIKALSFCDLSNNKTRVVSTLYAELLGAVFHDTERESKEWLKKRGWKKFRVNKSLLISLDTPWLPSEYPRTLGDLAGILSTQGHDEQVIASWLMNVFKNNAINPVILVRIKCPSGITVVSLGLEYSNGKTLNRKHAKQTLKAGFRKGHVPNEMILLKGRNIKLQFGKTTRGDLKWMYGRDKNTSLSQISTTKVAILGLGSVGSSVVSLLAKAGVSDFLLSDNENLETENISRHHLGFKSIKLGKAKELQKRITLDHPHALVEISRSKWEQDDELIDKLKDVDLIISCTADWPSDVLLMSLAKSKEITCPVIFGFTESYASVSHAVVNPACSDDALKVFTNTGELKEPVTIWNKSTIVDLPSCGGVFQPYGATELSYGHSLIAETALELITGVVPPDEFQHKVWIGNKRLVTSNKGQWNEKWIEANIDPKNGSFIYDASGRN